MALQDEIKNIERRVTRIEEKTAPKWPVISKYSFRQLLSPVQKIVWDNYDVLKDELGLTNEQFIMFRVFRNDFDLSEKVIMDNPLLLQGLQALLLWDLTYNDQPVMTQDEIERILAGHPYGYVPPEPVKAFSVSFMDFEEDPFLL